MGIETPKAKDVDKMGNGQCGQWARQVTCPYPQAIGQHSFALLVPLNLLDLQVMHHFLFYFYKFLYNTFNYIGFCILHPKNKFLSFYTLNLASMVFQFLIQFINRLNTCEAKHGHFMSFSLPH